MRREPITFRINPDVEPVQRPEPRVVVVNGTRYTLSSPAPVADEPVAAPMDNDESGWPTYPGFD
jgi:hypothetical protein